MKPMRFGIRALLLLFTLLFALTGCGLLQDIGDTYGEELGALGDAILDQIVDSADTTASSAELEGIIDEHGSYTSRDDVAAYLKAYGRLPENFITKSEARALGWDSSAGNLAQVAPGKSIGGDVFGNYEGRLPKANGRKYYECDIDYAGGSRGAKRIVFSNDGLIFYTADHYETFTQLN